VIVAIDTITLAWALAALLFVLAIWRVGSLSARAQLHAAAAGVLLLCAAAAYGMDVINTPEIIGALVIGAAVGLLLAREWPGPRLISLMTSLVGLSGCAALCAAAAIWLNPYAFGLVAEGGDKVETRQALMLVLTMLAGGAASSLAITVGIRRSMAGPALLALTIAMAGWSAAALAFLLQNVGMVVAGGLAGAAGMGSALRICGRAHWKGLAEAGRRP
jgi:H+-translocating NAD(P) transhydrogenase subunit beta